MAIGLSNESLVVGQGVTIEGVKKFCYLGDTIAGEGGEDMAVVSRIRSGWNQFRKLSSCLTAKDISMKMRGRRSCMLYGSETWPMKKESEMKLRRNEMKMLRWMVGVKWSDKVSNKQLIERLGLEDL